MTLPSARLMLCMVCIFILPGCSQPASPSNAKTLSKTSALPIEATVELGVIFQGEAGGINRWLQNQSDREIHVAKIETGCECVDVRLSKSQILPSERVLAQCVYDGKKEPNFVGALSIAVTLYDGDGNKIGKIEIPVEVRSKNDFPQI